MPEVELAYILVALPYVIFASIAGTAVWRRVKGAKA